MNTVDQTLRAVMQQYQVQSIETKKNSLEQFFVE